MDDLNALQAAQERLHANVSTLRKNYADNQEHQAAQLSRTVKAGAVAAAAWRKVIL